MADRPRDDDWWLASDGKWYPPELAEGAEPAEAPEPTDLRPGFTNAASVAVAASSILMLVAAWFGFALVPKIRSGEVDMTSVEPPISSAEAAYGLWTFAAIVVFLMTGVVVVAWMYSVSKALEARGPLARRWGKQWPIWGWFIPFANLVIPKLMFGEIERIAQEPYRGVPVAEGWKQWTRTGLADLWWAVWVVGQGLSYAQYLSSGQDNDAIASTIQYASASYVAMGAAGVALVLVMRRTQVFSQR